MLRLHVLYQCEASVQTHKHDIQVWSVLAPASGAEEDEGPARCGEEQEDTCSWRCSWLCRWLCGPFTFLPSGQSTAFRTRVTFLLNLEVLSCNTHTTHAQLSRLYTIKLHARMSCGTPGVAAPRCYCIFSMHQLPGSTTRGIKMTAWFRTGVLTGVRAAGQGWKFRTGVAGGFEADPQQDLRVKTGGAQGS